MLERVNQNWMTRQWNENDLSHDDIETLIEVEMIMNDFIQYPEFREGFFKLVQNIIKHCTQGLI